MFFKEPFDWMLLCGTKNGSSMASLWSSFILKSVYVALFSIWIVQIIVKKNVFINFRTERFSKVGVKMWDLID